MGISRHTACGLFDGFLDTGGNFIGFAIAPAGPSLAVAHNHHGCKSEAATTFDHGGTAFDLDHSVDQLTTCFSPSSRLRPRPPLPPLPPFLGACVDTLTHFPIVD